VVVVEVCQAHQELLEYDCDLRLGQVAWLHEVCAAPARTKLHDDPQVRAGQVRAVVLSYVRRVQAGENHNLAHDVVHLVLGILHVDDLDSDRVAGPPVKALVDLAEAATADAFLLRVERVGVDRFVRAQFGRHGARGLAQRRDVLWMWAGWYECAGAVEAG
jgi:hypothetical protein